MKTDTAEHVGMHAFERAGLGKAPFRFVGMEEKVIRHSDGTTQAAGCCDYCFAGIRYVFNIRSADGKAAKVGCNCIEKVGDAGLLRAYKSSPEFRRLQRDKRQAKAKLTRAAVRDLIDRNRAALSSAPHSRAFIDRQTCAPLTALDEAEWMFGACGAAGMARLLKSLTHTIAAL